MLEGTSGDHLVQEHAQSWVNEQDAQGHASWILNISKNGNSKN